ANVSRQARESTTIHRTAQVGSRGHFTGDSDSRRAPKATHPSDDGENLLASGRPGWSRRASRYAPQHFAFANEETRNHEAKIQGTRLTTPGRCIRTRILLRFQ